MSDTTFGMPASNPARDGAAMPAPVFVGDACRASSEVTAPCDSRSRAGAGLVASRHELDDQRDEIVCRCLRIALPKRPAA